LSFSKDSHFPEFVAVTVADRDARAVVQGNLAGTWTYGGVGAAVKSGNILSTAKSVDAGFKLTR